MKTKVLKISLLTLAMLMASVTNAQTSPLPAKARQSVGSQSVGIAPLPEPRQVEWQKMETYAFIHFGPNSFGDREWGYGDAPLSEFNPSSLDCDQWARVCKAAGMKGIILTAKHHDGFCLWPTKYTDYSIRNTPYKEGRGDIVGELAAACRRHGLKLGLYLSPWDRHQAFYGTPLYREYFHLQLQELLTQYGELFEVWFDGANGGDGYYGGARETRTIDRRTYYDYPRAWALVDSLQPQAVCFSDGGPGCRWVGNEQGYAFATNWSFLRSSEVYPGYEHYRELQQGHADGDKWVAAECNTSIRPGWFYHKREDEKVKTVSQLVDLYYRSVGHNGTFLLNFPVTPEGLIHPVDSQRAVDFHKQIESELKTNLLAGSKISVETHDGNNTIRRVLKKQERESLTDNNYDTYYNFDIYDGRGCSIYITMPRKTNINRLMLQEYIPLGQSVKAFKVEYLGKNGWTAIDCGEETTTIGYKRLLRFATIETRQLRITILDTRSSAVVSRAGAFFAPNAGSQLSDSWMETKGYDYSKTMTPTTIFCDLGNEKQVRSLHYRPSSSGIITHYEVLAGNSPESMHTVAKGEFSNIRNNPIMQDVYFTPVSARYVMLRAVKTLIPNEQIRYETLLIK